MKELIFKDIEDAYTVENFRRIKEFLESQAILAGEWKFVTFETTGATARLRVPHGLKFTPKDVLVTRKTGAGEVIWQYDAFDPLTITVGTTGPVTVRCFVGHFREGK